MIEQEKINITVAAGMKKAVGCEVVKANTANARIPPYPYISFTVLNTDTKKGTYSASKDRRYIPLTQTWSITVQSDKDNESQIKAIEVKDWLEETGRVFLNDHGIVVQKVGAITNRDTLLTISYEYRKGFDVIFSLLNEVEFNEELIESAKLNKEETGERH